MLIVKIDMDVIAMTKIRKIIVISQVVGLSISFLCSASFDNRFLPWNPRTVFRGIEKRSFVKAEGFFLTADSAYGDDSIKKKGIPEVYGKFDQKVLGQALVAVGLTNPLRPAWQLANNIKWNTHSKTQGQGLSLATEFAFNKIFSLGISGNFIHVTSNINFILPSDTKRDLMLLPADEVELDAQRRSMLTSLGLDKSRWSKSGLSDLKIYGRCGWAGEYILKSRKADFGISSGILFPTSPLRDVNNCASFPLDGNGHYGFIMGADFSLELKEDWFVDCLVQMNKRFEKTQNYRIPVLGEPMIFGATTGDMQVSPGLTVVISPTVRFEDLQDGFGAQLQYLYGFHGGDVWQDVRANKTIPIQYAQMYDVSKWKTEYLLFSVFYDMSRSSREKSICPVINFSWDIPAKILKPKNVSKTQRIALGFSLNF